MMLRRFCPAVLHGERPSLHVCIDSHEDVCMRPPRAVAGVLQLLTLQPTSSFLRSLPVLPCPGAYLPLSSLFPVHRLLVRRVLHQ
jgi:hypothetical protein